MSITPEDLAAIQRRQRIAEALMQQGQQPLETNQVAGGYVVPVSPLAGLSKIIQSMSGAYMGKKADERKAAMEREQQAAVTGIDFNSPDAPQKLIAAGRFEDGLKLAIEQQKEAKKVHREGIPSGFDKNEDGSIKPMTVEGYGDYANFLLQQAGAKKQQLGPFDEEKMDMSRDDQAMQHQALALSQANAARAAAQADFGNSIALEKLKRDEEAKAYTRTQNIPAAHRMAYEGNQTALDSIDEAIKYIKENPGHFGAKFFGPDKMNQMIDPEGVKARAMVTKIKALQKHELSGSAVTPSESKDYAPMFPNVIDDDTTIINKLEALKPIYGDINKRMEQIYSDPTEYRNPIEPKQPEYTPISSFRLSGKAANMPAEKKAIVERVLKSGTEEEKVKLLNKGWLEEAQ